jgi:hypothetical protein
MRGIRVPFIIVCGFGSYFLFYILCEYSSTVRRGVLTLVAGLILSGITLPWVHRSDQTQQFQSGD